MGTFTNTEETKNILKVRDKYFIHCSFPCRSDNHLRLIDQ